MNQHYRRIAAKHALQMVGCGVYHDGEHGRIIAADTKNYAEPMLRVQFGGGRIATLKPSEVGAC